MVIEPAAPAPPSRRSVWARAAGVAMALLAIGYLVKVVPIRDRCSDPEGLVCEPGLYTTVLRAQPLGLLALFALFSFGVLLTVERWRILLRLARVEVDRRAVARLTLESYAVGFFLPGGVGVEALRIAFIMNRHRDASLVKVAASVLVDRMMGFGAMCVIAASLALGGRGSDLGDVRYVFFVAPPAAIAGGLVLRYTPVLDWMNRGVLRRVVEPLREYVKAEQGMVVLGQSFLLSIVASAAQMAGSGGVVWALGASPTESAWIWIGVVAAFATALLPGMPGGVGTVEATHVFFFAKAGVPASMALATSLLLRGFAYALTLAGALSWLMRRRAAPQDGGGT